MFSRATLLKTLDGCQDTGKRDKTEISLIGRNANLQNRSVQINVHATQTVQQVPGWHIAGGPRMLARNRAKIHPSFLSI
jgi:hypothetical protein